MVIIFILFILFIVFNYLLIKNEYFATSANCVASDKSYGKLNDDNECISSGSATTTASGGSATTTASGDSATTTASGGSATTTASGDSTTATATASGGSGGAVITQITPAAESKSNTDCIPKNSNYGEICKNRFGNNFGISKIEDCENNTEGKKITCTEMIFNEINYSNQGKYAYATDCINDSLDLDTMCNYYMPDSIKNNSKEDGYNVNSAGLDVSLKGKDGDCYLTNGDPDSSKVRGICNFKRENKINRVRPISYENDYNKFTQCQNMTTHNFVNDCQTLLDEETEEEDVFADIRGFDCMPGYARAKCRDTKKDINMPVVPQ